MKYFLLHRTQSKLCAPLRHINLRNSIIVRGASRQDDNTNTLKMERKKQLDEVYAGFRSRFPEVTIRMLRQTVGFLWFIQPSDRYSLMSHTPGS